MTITSPVSIGMDVSKDKLDVAVWGEKNRMEIPNTKRGITKLVKQMSAGNVKRIVVEATGGYGESLVLALFEARLPVALVSPPRVRQYARVKYNHQS